MTNTEDSIQPTQHSTLYSEIFCQKDTAMPLSLVYLVVEACQPGQEMKKHGNEYLCTQLGFLKFGPF